MMFGRKKKSMENTHPGEIFAVQKGKVIPVTEAPDPVFAEKILGDGVAVQPETGAILSPVDGKIINVADTYHAYGIETSDGLELLVHIGINTVELNGKGFKNHVKEGDIVNVGDVLCDVDLQVVKDAGFEIWTPVLITNMDAVQSISIQPGQAQGSQTCVIRYQK